MPPKLKTKKNLETNENDDSVQTNYDRAAYAIVQMMNTFDQILTLHFSRKISDPSLIQNDNSSMGIIL